MLKDKRIIVVSPPRSATRTLCKAAEILGIESYHTDKFVHEFNVGCLYSDTPFYSREKIKRWVKDDNNIFIYSYRPPEVMYKSWNKWLLKQYIHMVEGKTKMTNPRQRDLEHYDELFSRKDTQKVNKKLLINGFNNHFKEIKNIIPESRLLVFNVEDGWPPLCNFLETNIPKEKFPISGNGEENKFDKTT